MKTYLVGGAVRDKLMGLEPKDRDWVIVGATPADVQALLDEGYERVGADFPVFLHPVTREEYALARVERKVAAGYHGFVVDADASVTIEQDLGRRDLTINSMAMDEAGNVIDPYGGRRDLHNHVLRHTTEAFAEDPLRVLRLARFAARYNFTVAPETIALCRLIGQSGELNHLSIERIWVELQKGFSEKHPEQMFEIMHETQALDRCDVLQRTFGSFLNNEQRGALKCVAKVVHDKEQRFVVGVCAAAARFSELKGAPKRVLDLYAHMHELAYAGRSASELMRVLKTCGALREGPAFPDLLMLAAVLSHGHNPPAFDSRDLEIGAQQLRSVRAVEFPGLQGKELGQAIDAKRVKCLQQAMSIPMGDSAGQQG